MCFGRMLKMCDAKYNGEDVEEGGIGFGQLEKVMVTWQAQGLLCKAAK